MTEKHKPTAPLMPESHLARMRELGLDTLAFLRRAREVNLSDGSLSYEFLPRLAIGSDHAVILWLDKDASGNDYGFGGWQCFHLWRSGGVREELHQALTWLERSQAIARGEATDFLGC